jgi:hypothetical protein
MYILPLAFLSISSKCLSQFSGISSRVIPSILSHVFRLMDGMQLTCSYVLSWITKDATQPDRVEGFLRAPLAATLRLMSDHGAHLRRKGQFGAYPNSAWLFSHKCHESAARINPMHESEVKACSDKCATPIVYKIKWKRSNLLWSSLYLFSPQKIVGFLLQPV